MMIDHFDLWIDGRMNRMAMEAAGKIFKSAYGAVWPHRLIGGAIRIETSNDGGNRELIIESTGGRYRLEKNIYVAAMGKAACGMSRAVEDLLGEDIVDGVVSMPVGTKELFRKEGLSDQLPRIDTRLRYYEGAKHNLPDEDAHRAAMEIKKLTEKLTEDDLFIVLVSGGGSALLPCPVHGVSLAEKTHLLKFLSQSGADIRELNTVRQNLSQLKGGRLATLAAARARRVISLIISDIVGDPLEFIASGPTYPSRTSPKDALKIIRKYERARGLDGGVSKSILEYLETAPPTMTLSNSSSTPSTFDDDRVDNIIIGSNRVALDAARAEAERLGYRTEIVDRTVTGEASAIGREHAARLERFLSSSTTNEANGQRSGRHCWLWGGETTVRVNGDGRGGRNQEMTLAFAAEAVRRKLADRFETNFAFLSAGTDGQDGPTDAAGAVVDREHLRGMTTAEDEVVKMIDDCLARNDSYKFFDEFAGGRCHVKSGLTGTNVMDVQIMIVDD